MSQKMRNEVNDIRGSSGRGSNEAQEEKNYEGFEGMNYEQRRKPYNPQHINNNRGNDSDGLERRDEL
jgi:hypothetical protein